MTENTTKMHFFAKKVHFYLQGSKKSSTFAAAFENELSAWLPRDANQRSVCGPKSVEQNEALYECIAGSRASFSSSDAQWCNGSTTDSGSVCLGSSPG